MSVLEQTEDLHVCSQRALDFKRDSAGQAGTQREFFLIASAALGSEAVR